MGDSFRIRRGQHKDASALAALATQVWLQTYATEGVTPDIAGYVLSEVTPARYLAVLDTPASHLFVAEQGQGLVGIARSLALRPRT